MTRVNSALARSVTGASARFRARLRDPGTVQRAHLDRLVTGNRSSRFGQAHGFATIRDEVGYASRVPVRHPDAFRPWIESLANGNDGELTNEPVIAFEQTGGSSAGPRLVPYTASGLAEFQTGLRVWLDDLFIAAPALAEGSFYWSISPAGRPACTTPSGVQIGLASDAAYFGAELAPHISASLVVPASVGTIADIAAWRRATLANLLAHDDLVMISVWSPSFLTSLLDGARRDHRAIAAAIANESTAGNIRARLVARVLESPAPCFGSLWPRLSIISCWDHASARAHANEIRAAFPGVQVQGKGLLATEGLTSIPLQDKAFPVLAIDSGYFEFREPGGRIRTAANVEDDGEYELILSNGSGLYRYAIGDIVRVRGFADRTPMLEFCGRASGTDLCGEKLSDAFATMVLAPHALRFCALAADPGAMRYCLVVDAAETSVEAADKIAERVESALHANPQYAYARSIGQLRPVRAARCSRPTAKWVELRTNAGQRLGDVKLPSLITDDDMRRELVAE